jgi:hypothetical protein
MQNCRYRTVPEISAGLKLGDQIYPSFKGPELDNISHLLFVAALKITKHIFHVHNVKLKNK